MLTVFCSYMTNLSYKNGRLKKNTNQISHSNILFVSLWRNSKIAGKDGSEL